MSVAAFRAKWVLPIDRPPVEGGWVEVAHGRVVQVGGGRAPSGAVDLGDIALLPGLVNAHTHLELSWLAGRVPPAASLPEWILSLIHTRRAGATGGRDEEHQAVYAAAAAVRDGGTAVVGDISNGLATAPAILAAGLSGVVFHELLGFNVADPAGAVREGWARVEAARRETGDGPLTFSVVAHAPYSVSPGLFRAIAARAGRTPLAVHLAESPEEIEFIRTGHGPMRQLLETLGAWTADWQAPGTDPVQYVSDLGYLLPGTLVVHAVHVTDDGLERLRKARATIITCPRSNLWVGAGPPRLAHFYAARVPVAVGTDSLASSPSLSVFDELAEMRRLAPEVAAATLLESATRVGAEALGVGREFGTLGAGKRAVFARVTVPAATTDVEEYLVSGVPAHDTMLLRP